MRTSLGIDIGSSSIKVSLMDIESGKCIASATNPSSEMAIISVSKGFAEQNPDTWWKYVCEGIRQVTQINSATNIASIGITYQMHGLVAVDSKGKPVRNSIIWCDSRAVEIGNQAFRKLGEEFCLNQLLNSPGNFTASKLAWVKINEIETYNRIVKFMLPGDYIAYLLSGEILTTESGLSEGILWNFAKEKIANEVIDYYGIKNSLVADTKPSIDIQCYTSSLTEKLLGIPAGTPISYRAGDQPNNAFSLNVMEPGEIAATGGTSGVVYGVTNEPKADTKSRVNTFLHVNHKTNNPRYGILLCINGTGIMNSWIHRNVLNGLDYPSMNELAASTPVGSDGVMILPFGNGAERMLCNKYTGAQFIGLDLVRHSQAHISRAAQEGIAFAFRYGIDIMRNLGLKPEVIRAGNANLFLSPLFRQTLATLTDAKIELFNTDGSLGAARGAALGAGYYSSRDEAFQSLSKINSIEPLSSDKAILEETYGKWKEELEKKLNN